MRKLCPNLDREDGLDTVLEVPIPEETFMPAGSSRNNKTRNMIKAWIKSHADHRSGPSSAGRATAELQLMLGVIGAPLVPLPIGRPHQSITTRDCKEDPMEVSMAKYIVQQYIAAAGGEAALDSVQSMYAMGKVRMTTSELTSGSSSSKGNANKKFTRAAASGGGGELGGFVLWQKRPDLWSLELVVSGCKISAGSDGKVAWRQTSWQLSHASRGPLRPLRRFLQGLDPRSTASLFADAVCTGEQAINGEDCFVLRVDAEAAALRARSSSGVELLRHTAWGYFSQRTGLLAQLKDSHLLCIKGASGGGDDDSVYWETTMESLIQDYRAVDGIHVAHAGRTTVSLLRFGKTREGQTRTRMEETWKVEEVDFNVWGLSMDCFLPPGDLKEEREGCGGAAVKHARPPTRIQDVLKFGSRKVAAIDTDDSDLTEEEDGTC